VCARYCDFLEQGDLHVIDRVGCWVFWGVGLWVVVVLTGGVAGMTLGAGGVCWRRSLSGDLC